MALTKKQKSEVIDKSDKDLVSSKALVFAEFNKVGVEDFKKLRKELKKVNAGVKVLKKSLLKIVLNKAGFDFNPITAAKNQMGTVFAKGDVTSVASVIHKFAKDLVKAKKGEFAVVGAYDLSDKKLISIDEFKAIATLPSREVLLAQIAMMLTMPLKQMMKVLEEKSKKA